MGRNDLVLVAAYTGRFSVSPANLDDSGQKYIENQVPEEPDDNFKIV